MFGEDFGDLTHDNKYPVPALCEECGFNCVVEPDGTCIAFDCLKQHGKRDEKQDDIVFQEQQIAAWEWYEYDSPP